MSVKIEIKAWVHGRRRILFQRLKREKDMTTASLLREILDHYFETKGPKDPHV